MTSVNSGKKTEPMEKQAPLKNVEENMKGDAPVPDGNAKAEGIVWESGEIKKAMEQVLQLVCFDLILRI